MTTFGKVYKTEAIVLKHFPLGEADYILTLFSPNRGKIRAVARGSRRIKSKLGGHIEPLMRTSFVINAGKNLDIISQAELIDGFRPLRENIHFLNLGIYMAELVDYMTQENQSNQETYRLLLESITAICNDHSPTLLPYFQLRMIIHNGFGPELYDCIECGTLIEPNKHRFCTDGGGVICLHCRPENVNILPLRLDTLKLLRFLSRSDWKSIQRLRLNRGNLIELNRITKELISYTINRDIISSTFLDYLYESFESEESV
ncbi:MAG: DNA repair protein RecO [Dehalococcoidia bacterium]|nr:DNA repair protein RecO [Dehalococcoidia bacterium]|tara:strand:+ start:1325 stop:2104 length:780 start_codon:yes stop_codon:yes gene_type:complete